MDAITTQIYQAKILIVDDLPENLQLLGSTLGAKGYRVAFATNGKQAINIAQSKSPDLILLDIQMPEMDGYETCKLLKMNTATKDIPVIFLTAKNEVEDIVAGFEMGAVDYITKPFNHTELLARVSTQLKVKFYFDHINSQNNELLQSQTQIALDAQKLILLNDNLLESEYSLKESNKEKDKLFSIIAHDLRGPFAGLLGLGQLLVEEYDRIEADERKSITDNLYQASKRLFSLVENLLIWARSQMNKIEYSPSHYRLGSIVDKTLLYYIDMLRSKDIDFECYIPEDIMVYCDSDMLSTVLRNLLSNAIKFTPKKGHIRLSAEIHDDELIIKVSDSGVGIEPNDIVKVFKIDSKISTPGTNDEPGTGLGLILCKEFIDRQKGRIWIESEIGIGTNIFIALPKSDR